MVRTNWIEIYSFFIASETTSLKDCAERFKISYDVLRQKASDEKWSNKKKGARQVALRLVEEDVSLQIAKINKLHVQMAQALLGRAAKALAEGALPTTARDIKSWIATGVAIERKALDMDQPQQKIETTNQVTKKYVWDDGISLEDYEHDDNS